MFEFFSTMENFANAVNNPDASSNNPQECISPEQPKYLENRKEALDQFEKKFNELMEDPDYNDLDDIGKASIDDEINQLFNKINNNNKKSSQELQKIEKEIQNLDTELDRNVNKIEQQKKIINRNKLTSDVQSQKLDNSVEKSKDIQKWYIILLSIIVIFIGIQSFVLFKL